MWELIKYLLEFSSDDPDYNSPDSPEFYVDPTLEATLDPELNSYPLADPKVKQSLEAGDVEKPLARKSPKPQSRSPPAGVCDQKRVKPSTEMHMLNKSKPPAADTLPFRDHKDTFSIRKPHKNALATVPNDGSLTLQGSTPSLLRPGQQQPTPVLSADVDRKNLDMSGYAALVDAKPIGLQTNLPQYPKPPGFSSNQPFLNKASPHSSHRSQVQISYYDLKLATLNSSNAHRPIATQPSVAKPSVPPLAYTPLQHLRTRPENISLPASQSKSTCPQAATNLGSLGAAHPKLPSILRPAAQPTPLPQSSNNVVQPGFQRAVGQAQASQHADQSTVAPVQRAAQPAMPQLTKNVAQAKQNIPEELMPQGEAKLEPLTRHSKQSLKRTSLDATLQTTPTLQKSAMVRPSEYHPPTPKTPIKGPQALTHPEEPTKEAKEGRYYIQFCPRIIEGHPYYPLGLIGRGGTGHVYRACNGFGKIFALKVVKLEKYSDEVVAGLKNEIAIMRSLKGSRWIVNLIHAEIQSNRALMVMELGDINFEALIQNQDPHSLNLAFIKLYWNHMLNAVHAIHTQNVVHTDLKPENFILSKGFLKLIDFGIARAIPKDHTSVIVEDEIGTLEYMAPEAIHGVNRPRPNPNGPANIKLRPSCDIWSLGCILYYMTYRRTPYSHLHRTIQYAQLTSENPASAITTPSTVYSQANTPLFDVPEELITIIWSCLKNEPSERPTAQQLRDNPFLSCS
ncbi:Dual-specificity kinase, spindle pole body (SPB) duplication and spindle checkpoint function [Massospora cicadina]|nr:Dual-specificity kinase, spindle pole body (SPB) duplication and spindle checkpoint function [Massospora cicadina]